MAIFSEAVIQSRRQRVSALWDTVLQDKDMVIVCSGNALTKPGGLDQTYDFIPHPDYYWLTGIRRPEGVVCYSKQKGWIDFVKPVSSAEILWEGSAEELPSGSRDVKELTDFLRTTDNARCFVCGENTLNSLALKNAPEMEWFHVRSLLHQSRRIKDSAEIDKIRQAAQIALHGYNKISNFIKDGVSEREIQIEYEAEVLRQGSEGLPYSTIVGTGDRSAVLHAIPTKRKVKQGEIVLIDAGAELSGYCVDITRVFSVGGKFSNQQKDLYSIVLAAQKSAIAAALPGAEWRGIHSQSAKIIIEGLKNLNILKGDMTSLINSDVVSAFYPHGVGHLVGLGVRDAGYLENRNPKKVCGVTLRVDMKIQEGQILTVEPGCYFISAMLNDKDIRNKYKDFINWSEAEKWLSIGGVRIEDDILIKKDSPENLTDLVEKYM